MGLLGGAAVLLYSVDQKTRLQGGKQRLVRRMRPPRVFEPQLPQLRTLEESMVLTPTLTLTLTNLIRRRRVLLRPLSTYMKRWLTHVQDHYRFVSLSAWTRPPQEHRTPSRRVRHQQSLPEPPLLEPGA